MATGETQLPSSLDTAPGQRGDRRSNVSPPPSQSKRDKKRQLLTERLATLNEKFTRDRDLMYREQLQRIQIDASLVMRVDPYREKPLDFLGASRKDRADAANEKFDKEGHTGRSLLEMAGPMYHEWLDD